jgi:eukaryotic-like serine/threonine-protein kinase
MPGHGYSREFVELQTMVAGKYTLEREVGRGGMGIVFLARDVALDRPVALKLLPPYLASQSGFRDRFLSEARLAARLSHPNIVTIHAVEEHDDLVFFVMAYIRGETLTQRVERTGPLSAAEATRLLQEVAWGLGYAHANGVIHRDVKPDNVLIEQGSGRAMVADFGVAFAADANRLTAAGQLVGTPHYVSPEQASGDPVDARSDLYSLGMTAFFALTGRPAFDAASPIAVVTKHLTEAPPALESIRPDLPAPLVRAVARCLEKEPARRFDSGEELAEALAATGLTERDVPAPIRHYFRQGRGIALGWLMLVALVVWFGRWVRIPPDGISRVSSVVLLLLAVLWPLAFLVRTARRALQVGLTFDDVRSAAMLEARILAEESRAVYGGTHSGDLSRSREDWLRLLAGPMGRFIFVLAGVGLHAYARAPRPDSQPPERVVKEAAVSLYDDLPTELRERFTELPEVGEELCCRVEEMRGEPGQQEELSRVIGALERVRVDLMKLQAGEGSPDALSAALQDAARINQETGTRPVA